MWYNITKLKIGDEDMDGSEYLLEGFFVACLIVIGIPVAIILFIGWATQTDDQKNPQKTNTDKINKIVHENEISGIRYFAYDYSNCAIINEETQTLNIITGTPHKNFPSLFDYSLRIVPFDKIIEAEVVMDNQSITKSSRGSQLVGVGVGTLALGGIGAIIGGTTGTKKHIDKIKNIDIKLTIKELQNPISKINFLNKNGDGLHMSSNNGRAKDHPLVKQALRDVEKWQGMFDVILKQQDEVVKKSAQ